MLSTKPQKPFLFAAIKPDEEDEISSYIASVLGHGTEDKIKQGRGYRTQYNDTVMMMMKMMIMSLLSLTQ